MRNHSADERARLLRELDESRLQLEGELFDLGQAVNLRERLQASVRRHPAWWMAGGVAGGIVLANLLRPPRRRRRGAGGDAAEMVKHSAFLGLLEIAGKQILRLSEPALKHYAQQEIERWMDSRSGKASTNSKSSPPRPKP